MEQNLTADPELPLRSPMLFDAGRSVDVKVNFVTACYTQGVDLFFYPAAAAATATDDADLKTPTRRFRSQFNRMICGVVRSHSYSCAFDY
jgi:hypothetical protein